MASSSKPVCFKAGTPSTSRPGQAVIQTIGAPRSRFGHKPSVSLDTHGHLIKGADAATRSHRLSVGKTPEILQRGHHSPARDRRPGPRQMDTPHGARLADRPLRRLFRDHVDCLPRLAPAARGRGSPHGHRGAAGGPASFDTGSLVLFSGCILRRRWGAGGGSAC